MEGVGCASHWICYSQQPYNPGWVTSSPGCCFLSWSKGSFGSNLLLPLLWHSTVGVPHPFPSHIPLTGGEGTLPSFHMLCLWGLKCSCLFWPETFINSAHGSLVFGHCFHHKSHMTEVVSQVVHIWGGNQALSKLSWLYTHGGLSCLTSGAWDLTENVDSSCNPCRQQAREDKHAFLAHLFV